MKNVLRFLLAALVLTGMAVTDASAERIRVEKTIRWLAVNSAVADGAFQTQEGTKPLASEALDTTGVFNMQDADVDGHFLTLVVGSENAQDSLIVGYLVAYSDSSADGASTLTAVTATIDASGDGQDWATVCTAAGIAASDDPIVAIPLVLRPGLDHQNLLTNAPKLRIRFTTVTGYLLAARLKLVYWANPRAQ